MTDEGSPAVIALVSRMPACRPTVVCQPFLAVMRATRPYLTKSRNENITSYSLDCEDPKLDISGWKDGCEKLKADLSQVNTVFGSE